MFPSHCLVNGLQGKIFSDLYAAVPSALHGLPIGSPFTFTAFFKAHPAIAVFFDDLLNYLYFLLASMLLGNIKSQTFRVSAMPSCPLSLVPLAGIMEEGAAASGVAPPCR